MAGDLRDLRVWQEATALAADVVRAAGKIRGPGALAAADQLARAAESIAANIAEGYGRGWGRDGVRFLRIARGSAAELETLLTIAGASGRLEASLVTSLVRRAQLIRAMLHGLISRVAVRTRA